MVFRTASFEDNFLTNKQFLWQANICQKDSSLGLLQKHFASSFLSPSHCKFVLVFMICLYHLEANLEGKVDLIEWFFKRVQN